MEILLWLLPPVVVTVIVAAWVGWRERERPAPDRDAQVRRLGAALSQEPRAGYAAGPRPRDRSTGVAVRRGRPASGGSRDRRDGRAA